MWSREHRDDADTVMLGVVLVWCANNVYVEVVLNAGDLLVHAFARVTFVLLLGLV